MTEISSSKTLHRLVYTSRERVDPGQEAQAFADIVRASIRNNHEAAITGLLLSHKGFFIQALEGPAEAVLTTYGRICNDTRHTDSKVLSAGPVTSREFADWSMCARRITPADDAILHTLDQRTSFEPQKLSGRSAMRLLMAVRGIQGRTQRSALG